MLTIVIRFFSQNSSSCWRSLWLATMKNRMTEIVPCLKKLLKKWKKKITDAFWIILLLKKYNDDQCQMPTVFFSGIQTIQFVYFIQVIKLLSDNEYKQKTFQMFTIIDSSRNKKLNSEAKFIFVCDGKKWRPQILSICQSDSICWRCHPIPLKYMVGELLLFYFDNDYRFVMQNKIQIFFSVKWIFEFSNIKMLVHFKTRGFLFSKFWNCPL